MLTPTEAGDLTILLNQAYPQQVTYVALIAPADAEAALVKLHTLGYAGYVRVTECGEEVVVTDRLPVRS